MKLETLCLHGGTQPDPTTLSRAVPIYRTSSYVFKSAEHAANLFALKELGNIYTRLMNPTTDVLEKRVALLEGGPELGGLGVASGTSGIFYSIINLAQFGDNIVSARNLYGGTYTQFHDILPTLGITTKFVDSNDPQNFARAIDDKTRALFCETVSNPALEITDLEAVARIAHDHGIPLIVDATFSTPYLTQPLEHGADIVVHSLTKWFGGHGTGIGGVVVDSGKFPWAAGKHPLYTTPDTSYHGLRWGIDLPEPLRPLAFILRMRTVPLRNLGACISPDNSWMFLQGIETLPLTDGTPLRERPRRREVPQVASQGGVGAVPRARGRSHVRPQPEVPSRQGGGHGRLRHQGGQGGGAGVHRRPQAVFPPGQCRRCQEPGHPPGHDHPLAARRRAAASGRHHPGAGAPERGNRAY